MKKFNLINIVFTMSISICTAQVNLVPNPGFEQYSICPDQENQVPYANGWENWQGTPDYFNACAPNGNLASVPYSWYNSFQYAHSGNGYAGLFTYWTKALSSIYPWLREEIAVQLNQPLQIGVQYFLKMYVSLASFIPTPCASNKIGIKFTTQSFAAYGNTFTTPLVNNVSHIFCDTLIKDTLNWVLFSGSFTADSAYQYLVIGNFFDDLNTDTLIMGSVSLCYSYYFIDDVCLSTDSLGCFTTDIEKLNVPDKFLFYPNPFSKEAYIELSSWTQPELILFNYLGERCEFKYSKVNNGNSVILKIEKGNLRSGIYFLSVQEKMKSKVIKIIVQ